MKRTFLFLSALILSGLFAACGSTPATDSRTAANSNANTAAVVNANTNSDLPPAVPGQQAPGISVTQADATPNANAASAGDLEMANRRRVVDVPGPTPSGPPPSVPAPENSAISTTMSRDGSFVETRVFNDDKDIAKIERISNGKTQSVKIYLKSSRVVAVSPGKVGAINVISLADLRSLAGIRPPPPPKLTERDKENIKKNVELKRAQADQ